MKKNSLFVKIMAGTMAGIMLLVTIGGILSVIISNLG